MSDSQQNTALVVEDELFIVLEIEEIVQPLGISCTALSEVAGALKWLKTNVPKFAVVDYRLRDTTSEKLVARLTELRVPTLQNLCRQKSFCRRSRALLPEPCRVIAMSTADDVQTL
jgi:ActR/RegA family two-component response regulator